MEVEATRIQGRRQKDRVRLGGANEDSGREAKQRLT